MVRLRTAWPHISGRHFIPDLTRSQWAAQTRVAKDLRQELQDTSPGMCGLQSHPLWIRAPGSRCCARQTAQPRQDTEGADPSATLIERDSRQTSTGAVCRTGRRTASVLEPERLWFAVRRDRNMALKQSVRCAVSITCFSLSKRPRSCKGRLRSKQQFRQVYIDFPIWLPPVLLQPVGMIAQTFFQGPLFVPVPADWRFIARLIAGRVHVVSNCGIQRASFCKPQKKSQPASE